MKEYVIDVVVEVKDRVLPFSVVGSVLMMATVFDGAWYASLAVFVASVGLMAYDKSLEARGITLYDVFPSQREEAKGEAQEEAAPEGEAPKEEAVLEGAAPEEAAPEVAAQEVASVLDILGAADRPHVLLAGGTGVGKTTLAKHIISRRMRKHENHEVLIIDPHAEFGDWQGLTVVAAGEDWDEYASALDRLQMEAKRIYKRLASGDIQRSEIVLKTIYFGEWFAAKNSDEIGKDGQKVLKNLIVSSRKAGYRMIIDTQSARVKALGFDGEGDIRDSLTIVELDKKAGKRTASIDGEPVALAGPFVGSVVQTSSLADRVHEVLTGPLGQDSEIVGAISAILNQFSVENGTGLVHQNGREMAMERASVDPLEQGRPALNDNRPALKHNRPALKHNRPALKPEIEQGGPDLNGLLVQQDSPPNLDQNQPDLDQNPEPHESTTGSKGANLISAPSEAIAALNALGESEDLLLKLTLLASQKATKGDMHAAFSSKTSRLKKDRSRIIDYVRSMAGG